MICKNCGLKVNDQNICPFCGTAIGSVSNEDYNDIFKEEKMQIDFNIKNILNNVDYRNEFENIKVEAASKKDQYNGMDLIPENIEKIDIIDDYYNDSVNIYKKNQKKNLELFDIQMLQSHVASFNETVNNCDNFKKMVPEEAIQDKLDKTIKSYNKEIHYIKKYFILPLYDFDGLLNRSKIVKCLITLLSICICNLLLTLPVFSGVFSLIHMWCEGFVEVFPRTVIKLSLSVLGSIYLAEILFQLFLNITIKNKNFQVDKNKKFDIHWAVALLAIPFSCLTIYVAYASHFVFLAYIVFVAVKCILVKKWNLESIIEKIACVIIVLILFANNFFLFNGV